MNRKRSSPRRAAGTRSSPGNNGNKQSEAKIHGKDYCPSNSCCLRSRRRQRLIVQSSLLILVVTVMLRVGGLSPYVSIRDYELYKKSAYDYPTTDKKMTVSLYQFSNPSPSTQRKQKISSHPRVMGYSPITKGKPSSGLLGRSHSSPFQDSPRAWSRSWRALDANQHPPRNRTKTIQLYKEKRKHASEDPWDDADHSDDGKADAFETDDCKAQYEWQKTFQPSCNDVHEMDITDLQSTHTDAGSNKKKVNNRIIGNGYWRDVWTVSSSSSSASAFQAAVLKTMRYEHYVSERNLDRNRRDAVAMDQLTSSIYILDVYAFCANSGLFEYADGGSLEDTMFDPKVANWTSREKLVIAQQAAAGLSALHNFAADGVPAISHADIVPSQFVHVPKDGIYKLNDFNRARFIRKNVTSGELCTYHVGSNPGKFRSPEEYTKPHIQTAKVDVYSLGNIFYALLTGEYPFEHKKTKKAQKAIAGGERPDIPETLANSTDTDIQTLLEAIHMCWVQSPKQRTSAKALDTFLRKALTATTQKG